MRDLVSIRMIQPNSIWVKRLVPIGVVVAIGYGNYAVCYSLGRNDVFEHESRGSAIVLWVLSGLFQVLLFMYWGVLLWVGPGKCDKIPPYDLYGTGDGLLTPVPEYFFCDQYGYPIWCTNCQSIRPERALHQKDMGKCMPKFDHYCLWVGTAIGQDNYKYFLKFLQIFCGVFVVLLVYLLVYTKLSYDRGLNNNIIVLYILSGFFLMMIGGLLVSHIWYLQYNLTTLDDMNIRHARKYRRWERRKKQNKRAFKPAYLDDGVRYINVAHDDVRLVIPCSIDDKFYNFGFRKTWINIFLYENSGFFYDDSRYYSLTKFLFSIMVFLIPIIDLFVHKYPPHNEVTLSPSFRALLQEKIHRRRCYLPLYARLPSQHSEEQHSLTQNKQ